MKGPTKYQTYRPTGWLRMGVWRSLRRTESAIISWDGSLYYLGSEQKRSWSDCADAQADLRLCCSHMAWTDFLMARLIWQWQSTYMYHFQIYLYFGDRNDPKFSARDRSGHKLKTQIRIYTVCYSICYIFWMHYSVVKQHFRIITPVFISVAECFGFLWFIQ